MRVTLKNDATKKDIVGHGIAGIVVFQACFLSDSKFVYLSMVKHYKKHCSFYKDFKPIIAETLQTLKF